MTTIGTYSTALYGINIGSSTTDDNRLWLNRHFGVTTTNGVGYREVELDVCDFRVVKDQHVVPTSLPTAPMGVTV